MIELFFAIASLVLAIRFWKEMVFGIAISITAVVFFYGGGLAIGAFHMKNDSVAITEPNSDPVVCKNLVDHPEKELYLQIGELILNHCQAEADALVEKSHSP